MLSVYTFSYHFSRISYVFLHDAPLGFLRSLERRPVLGHTPAPPFSLFPFAVKATWTTRRLQDSSLHLLTSALQKAQSAAGFERDSINTEVSRGKGTTLSLALRGLFFFYQMLMMSDGCCCVICVSSLSQTVDVRLRGCVQNTIWARGPLLSMHDACLRGHFRFGVLVAGMLGD